MSGPNDGSSSPNSQLSSCMLCDLVDSAIVDVASECHRIARLGLDQNLEEEEEEMRLSKQARERLADSSNVVDTNSKYVVDIFGQTHPPVANETFECMNCGRSIVAGRFAPHLEKCMGKGRKARPKTTRSSTTAHNRHSSSTVAHNRHSSRSPVSAYAHPSSSTISRIPNGSSGSAGDETRIAPPTTWS